MVISIAIGVRRSVLSIAQTKLGPGLNLRAGIAESEKRVFVTGRGPQPSAQ
jgi:hypothetical protein